MKAVFKFPLPVTDVAVVEMPVSAQVLTVQTQRGQPCIWAMCDEDGVYERRVFRVLGTGHSIPDKYLEKLRYVSTFQLNGGDYIFHVFEQVDHA